MARGGRLNAFLLAAVAFASAPSAMAATTVTLTTTEAKAVSEIYAPSTRTAMTSTEFLALSSSLSSPVRANPGNYTISKLSDTSTGISLYSAQPKGCKGHILYMGTYGTNGYFNCAVTLYADTSKTITCTGASGTVVEVEPATASSRTAKVYDANAEEVVKKGLLPWLLVCADAHQAGLATISQSNKDRHSTAKDYVGGIYFLVGVGMMCLVLMGTVWMNWLFQPIAPSVPVEDENSPWPWRNLLMWGMLIVFSLNVISLAGGFMGWCVSGSLVFFFIAGVHIAYAWIVHKCKCCTKKEDAALEASSQINNKNEDGAVQEMDDIKQQGSTDTAKTDDPEAAKQAPAEEGAAPVPYGKMPGPLHHIDYKILIGIWGCFFLTGFIVLMVAFPGWTIDEYILWDRMEFAQVGEFQPSSVAKMLQMMYAWDNMATSLKFNTFADIATDYCLSTKRTYLEPDERQAGVYDEFVGKYSINMDQYDPSDWNVYTSQNDWFIRKLAPGARTICSLEFPTEFPRTLVAPADARVMAWQTSMASSRYWVKNKDVDVNTMLGSTPSNVDASVWTGGPMVVFRLAPQDYHRFHSPVKGTVVATWEEGGTILSVSADAALSDNAVFLNSRKVVVVDTDCCGKMAYIAIGATCVGSVILYNDAACTNILKAGDNVTQGSQMGIMQFGGSTVVMLFEPGKITVDGDIVKNTGSSDRYSETLMQMGESFATY